MSANCVGKLNEFLLDGYNNLISLSCAQGSSKIDKQAAEIFYKIFETVSFIRSANQTSWVSSEISPFKRVHIDVELVPLNREESWDELVPLNREESWAVKQTLDIFLASVNQIHNKWFFENPTNDNQFEKTNCIFNAIQSMSIHWEPQTGEEPSKIEDGLQVVQEVHEDFYDLLMREKFFPRGREVSRLKRSIHKVD
jgi:hypothetical protein